MISYNSFRPLATDLMFITIFSLKWLQAAWISSFPNHFCKIRYTGPLSHDCSTTTWYITIWPFCPFSEFGLWENKITVTILRQFILNNRCNIINLLNLFFFLFKMNNVMFDIHIFHFSINIWISPNASKNINFVLIIKNYRLISSMNSNNRLTETVNI